MSETSESPSHLDLLLDVPVRLSAELASCNKSTEEILRLDAGSVVASDKIAGAPVELYANRKLLARGEVVLAGENLGIKVTEIIMPSA